MRVLVTGSRQFTDQSIVYEHLDEAYREWFVNDFPYDGGADFIVVHGGATGADALAGQWVQDRRSLAVPPSMEVHPANWRKHGRQAGPIRNHHMVSLGADLVLAFFWPGAANVGTRHCVQEARTWLEFKGTAIKEVWP
jgi:hypothetical protein